MHRELNKKKVRVANLKGSELVAFFSDAGLASTTVTCKQGG